MFWSLVVLVLGRAPGMGSLVIGGRDDSRYLHVIARHAGTSLHGTAIGREEGRGGGVWGVGSRCPNSTPGSVPNRRR